jgi:uncharacterized membrane protein
VGQTEQEPDPRKRVPTVLWLLLGLIVAVALAAVVIVHGHPGGKSVYGPPAGAPATH